MKSVKFHQSIKTKLFIALFLVIAGLVSLGVFLNTFFFESYYRHQQEEVFVQMAQYIGELHKDESNFEPSIERYSRMENVTIEVVDASASILYSSIAKNQKSDKLPSEISKLIATHRGNSPIYQAVSNDNNTMSSQKLVYITSFSPNSYLIISKSLHGIRESISIANQFQLIVGLMIIVIGGFATILLARKFTKPILSMRRITKKMADLEFDHYVDVRNQDEIGLLAENINSISDKLKDSIGELQADIIRRKQLVRDISHELKTPIGIIKGYSEGITFGVADTPELHDQYMATIIKECDQMDQMVKEMIELSSYEYSEAKLDYTTIATEDFIHHILERFEAIFHREKINFTYHNQVDTFNGDYRLISRAVSNYLTNAIKHVNAEKMIKLTISQDSNRVCFSVYNTGDTIDPKDALKLWDPFYKADQDRNRSIQGSGLGLAMVKEIAHLHKGRCGLENNQQGVTFYLCIPHHFI